MKGGTGEKAQNAHNLAKENTSRKTERGKTSFLKPEAPEKVIFSGEEKVIKEKSPGTRASLDFERNIETAHQSKLSVCLHVGVEKNPIRIKNFAEKTNMVGEGITTPTSKGESN